MGPGGLDSRRALLEGRHSDGEPKEEVRHARRVAGRRATLLRRVLDGQPLPPEHERGLRCVGHWQDLGRLTGEALDPSPCLAATSSRRSPGFRFLAGVIVVAVRWYLLEVSHDW